MIAPLQRDLLPGAEATVARQLYQPLSERYILQNVDKNICSTMHRYLLSLIAFLSLPASINAQGFEPIRHRATVSWVPPAGQNGVEASVEVAIKYDVFMNEPTRMATGRATIGDRVYYDGNVYTRSQVGEEIFDDFDFGIINILADIYVGPTKISTVRFGSLMNNDIAGSPDWDEIFPGVGAEAAKDAFRTRFSIQNVRLVDVSNRISGMAGWVKEREQEQAYTDAMGRARRMEQAGDLEGARAAYDEASRAKPGDDAASTARQRVDTELQAQEAERQRREQAAEQARQQAEAQREAAAAAQRQQEQQDRDAAQRRADEAAARDAERRRQQQEEFERIQREGRERQRQIEETQDRVREGIAAGMAQSNATEPFFGEGMGLYLKMMRQEVPESFLQEEGTEDKALSFGMVGPLGGRFTVNVGVTIYKGDESTPFYPTYEGTDTPVDEESVSYYGGDIGLGMKLGRGWGILSNLAYPYASVNLGEYSTYDAGRMEEPVSEYVYSFEYGVRGMLSFLYYQVGYSEHYDQMVYSFGIVNPIRYGRHKKRG